MTLVIGSLQLGFLYGILALGIYVTFRILNIPDLTAEGSFTLEDHVLRGNFSCAVP